MEYAVCIFLETKEVNSVLRSEYKPDPACPLLDFENLPLRLTVIRLEDLKQFPEGSRYLQSGALPGGGRHADAEFRCEHWFQLCGIINWEEGSITAVIVISSFTQLHLTMQKS